MKIIIILIAFVLLARCKLSNNYSEFSVLSDTLNIGTIQSDTAIKINWVFKNTGTQDLVIKKIDVSCGCLIPEFNQTSIKPNSSDSFRVIYKPIHMPGKFLKRISVLTNGKKKINMLYLKGFITN